MSVYSYLWYKDENNNMRLKSSEFDDGSNVYKVEASDSYSASTSGNYCVTEAHYALLPPGLYSTGKCVEFVDRLELCRSLIGDELKDMRKGLWGECR